MRISHKSSQHITMQELASEVMSFNDARRRHEIKVTENWFSLRVWCGNPHYWPGVVLPKPDGLGPPYTIATFTQWIGGREPNRQLQSSPPSRPIQSWPVVVPK